jgi:hypothetical protein
MCLGPAFGCMADSPLEEAGFELFVPLGISASLSWSSRARKPHGAPRGEFLRGGTNSSNPSPSSAESGANLIFGDESHR